MDANFSIIVNPLLAFVTQCQRQGLVHYPHQCNYPTVYQMY